MTRKQRKQKEQKLKNTAPSTDKKKVPKPKTPKERDVPFTHTTSLAQKDAVNHKAITIISALAIVGTFVFLLVFFTSGVSDKIVASNKQPAVSTSTQGLNETGSGKSSFHLTIMPRDGITQEDVVAYLDSMDDATFQQFFEALIESVDEDKLTTIDSSYTIDVAELDTVDVQEVVAKRDAILTYLKELSPAEFEALLQAVQHALGVSDDTSINEWVSQDNHLESKDGESSTLPNVNGTTEPEVSKPLQSSIDEAYREAERLYPNQIDASKRLKLIEDRNAMDYLYYVAEDGDTLLALSKAFDVPLGQLVELNGIQDADVIPAGMIILFPQDTEQPDLSSDS